MEVVFEQKETGAEQISKLAGGTCITGLPGHPDSVYVKMDKDCCRNTGTVHLNWSMKHSVVYNLKTGTLRSIPYDTVVVVLVAKVLVHRVKDVSRYLK